MHLPACPPARLPACVRACPLRASPGCGCRQTVVFLSYTTVTKGPLAAFVWILSLFIDPLFQIVLKLRLLVILVTTSEDNKIAKDEVGQPSGRPRYLPGWLPCSQGACVLPVCRPA